MEMTSHAQVAFAAPHPAAARAASEVVEAGGNAIDAAIAGAAALTVAYPHQCSVGGDLIAMVRPPGGEPRAVLSAGAAAAGTDVAALRAAGDRMPDDGPPPVTVPGVVAGWVALAGLGARLGLDRLLAPAVALARNGVPVSAGLHRAVRDGLARVRADAGLSALLLRPDGSPVREGDLLVQPALADTLEAAGAGWAAFYPRLLDGLRRLGSSLTETDFAAHRAEVAAPLSATVGGVTWFVAPPPSQGATLLAILSGSEGRGAGGVLRVAQEARTRRDALLGDPRTGPIDLDGLLDGPRTEPVGVDSAIEEAGRETARTEPANPGSAIEGAGREMPEPSGDTVAVTAVGVDGTAVSLIQSVFQSFGAGVLDPVSGAVLHNRGSAFKLDPAHPGRITPGSRPPHTLCPTLALADGDATVVALGCQGGYSQPWILAQVARDLLAADDPQAVLTRPRWIIESPGSGRTVATLVLEPGVPGAGSLRATADRLGLAAAEVDGPHDRAGHVQAARLRGAELAAASDVRADGQAAILRRPSR